MSSVEVVATVPFYFFSLHENLYSFDMRIIFLPSVEQENVALTIVKSLARKLKVNYIKIL